MKNRPLPEKFLLENIMNLNGNCTPLITVLMKKPVILLKKFLKGVGVYGAEIKVGGFSGYLCELLIIHYGSFLNLLKSVVNWRWRRKRIVIDIEKSYEKKGVDPTQVFDSPLIVIDPIDDRRNVASALREDRLSEFIAAAKAFLRNPSEHFFFPPKQRPLLLSDILNH